MLRLGDEPLTPAALAAAARAEGPLAVELTAAARERMAAAHRVMAAATDLQDVYGRTTGVGANRDVQVDADEARAHSVRLLRSHAGGMGRPLPPDIVRGTLVVRLAQMAAGGGGHRREVADALIDALAGGPLPELRNLGGIGTGDLTLLGQLGLALEERGLEIQAGDALALMSSNAATFASAALAWHDVAELLDAGLAIAALTFCALEGNQRGVRGGRRRRAAARRPRRGQRAAARAHRRRAGRRRGSRTRSGCAASRRWPARSSGRSATCTTCSPSRSTRRRRTRWWRGRRSCTTAASTTRPARSRSTGCGWRSSRSRASPPRASRT